MSSLRLAVALSAGLPRASLWLCTLLAIGCAPTSPPAGQPDGGCRCAIEVTAGTLSAVCGTSICIGGVGYRCGEDGAVVDDSA